MYLAYTVVAIHYISVQQLWYFPITIQESRRSSTAEVKQILCQPHEELQAGQISLISELFKRITSHDCRPFLMEMI